MGKGKGTSQVSHEPRFNQGPALPPRTAFPAPGYVPTEDEKREAELKAELDRLRLLKQRRASQAATTPAAAAVAPSTPPPPTRKRSATTSSDSGHSSNGSEAEVEKITLLLRLGEESDLKLIAKKLAGKIKEDRLDKVQLEQLSVLLRQIKEGKTPLASAQVETLKQLLASAGFAVEGYVHHVFINPVYAGANSAAVTAEGGGGYLVPVTRGAKSDDAAVYSVANASEEESWGFSDGQPTYDLPGEDGDYMQVGAGYAAVVFVGADGLSERELLTLYKKEGALTFLEVHGDDALQVLNTKAAYELETGQLYQPTYALFTTDQVNIRVFIARPTEVESELNGEAVYSLASDNDQPLYEMGNADGYVEKLEPGHVVYQSGDVDAVYDVATTGEQGVGVGVDDYARLENHSQYVPNVPKGAAALQLADGAPGESEVPPRTARLTGEPFVRSFKKPPKNVGAMTQGDLYLVPVQYAQLNKANGAFEVTYAAVSGDEGYDGTPPKALTVSERRSSGDSDRQKAFLINFDQGKRRAPLLDIGQPEWRLIQAVLAILADGLYSKNIFQRHPRKVAAIFAAVAGAAGVGAWLASQGGNDDPSCPDNPEPGSLIAVCELMRQQLVSWGYSPDNFAVGLSELELQQLALIVSGVATQGVVNASVAAVGSELGQCADHQCVSNFAARSISLLEPGMSSVCDPIAVPEGNSMGLDQMIRLDVLHQGREEWTNVTLGNLANFTVLRDEQVVAPGADGFLTISVEELSAYEVRLADPHGHGNHQFSYFATGTDLDGQPTVSGLQTCSLNVLPVTNLAVLFLPPEYVSVMGQNVSLEVDYDLQDTGDVLSYVNVSVPGAEIYNSAGELLGVSNASVPADQISGAYFNMPNGANVSATFQAVTQGPAGQAVAPSVTVPVHIDFVVQAANAGGGNLTLDEDSGRIPLVFSDTVSGPSEIIGRNLEVSSGSLFVDGANVGQGPLFVNSAAVVEFESSADFFGQVTAEYTVVTQYNGEQAVSAPAVIDVDVFNTVDYGNVHQDILVIDEDSQGWLNTTDVAQAGDELSRTKWVGADLAHVTLYDLDNQIIPVQGSGDASFVEVLGAGRVRVVPNANFFGNVTLEKRVYTTDDYGNQLEAVSSSIIDVRPKADLAQVFSGDSVVALEGQVYIPLPINATHLDGDNLYVLFDTPALGVGVEILLGNGTVFAADAEGVVRVPYPLIEVHGVGARVANADWHGQFNMPIIYQTVSTFDPADQQAMGDPMSFDIINQADPANTALGATVGVIGQGPVALNLTSTLQPGDIYDHLIIEGYGFFTINVNGTNITSGEAVSLVDLDTDDPFPQILVQGVAKGISDVNVTIVTRSSDDPESTAMVQLSSTFDWQQHVRHALFDVGQTTIVESGQGLLNFTATAQEGSMFKEARLATTDGAGTFTVEGVTYGSDQEFAVSGNEFPAVTYNSPQYAYGDPNIRLFVTTKDEYGNELETEIPLAVSVTPVYDGVVSFSGDFSARQANVDQWVEFSPAVVLRPGEQAVQFLLPTVGSDVDVETRNPQTGIYQAAARTAANWPMLFANQDFRLRRASAGSVSSPIVAEVDYDAGGQLQNQQQAFAALQSTWSPAPPPPPPPDGCGRGACRRDQTLASIQVDSLVPTA